MIERHEFGIVIVAFNTRDFSVIAVIWSGSLLMNSSFLEKDDVMWYVCARSIQDVVQYLSEFYYDAAVLLFVMMIQYNICKSV